MKSGWHAYFEAMMVCDAAEARLWDVGHRMEEAFGTAMADFIVAVNAAGEQIAEFADEFARAMQGVGR